MVEPSGLLRSVRRELAKRQLQGIRLLRRVYPQLGYREEDVVIASFPKSGRNWVRFLLANTAVAAGDHDIEINFINSREWISTTLPKAPPTDGFPRFVASHGIHGGERTRVIYILRHPADVMESNFEYRTNRWNESYESFSTFIHREDHGIPSWKRHVESWEDVVDVLVTFENLKADPKRELERMLTLVERDISDDELEWAVEQSSFENMSRVEEKYGKVNKIGANQEYTFMRRGEADKGVTVFDQSDYEYLERVAGDIMDRYGYEVPDAG